MYGLPTDTKRKQFRTKTVPSNGLNPVYDEEAFIFKKVVLPELACLRITAYEDSGKMIGHRVVPVSGLRPGYRHLVLRNESGQPLNLPTLFLNITVKDYVPDGLSELAEALANPIKYQNELDKRAKQLSVFQDDTVADDSSDNSEPTTAPHTTATATVTTAAAAAAAIPPPPMQKPSWNASIRIRPVPVDSGSSSPNSGTSPAPTTSVFPPTNRPESVDEGKKSIVGPMPPPPPNLGAFSESGKSEKPVAVVFSPEPFEKLFENKTYRDKRQQLEKKMEELRKKHEKDRKIAKAPRKSHHKLVKRLSSKSLYASTELSLTLSFSWTLLLLSTSQLINKYGI